VLLLLLTGAAGVLVWPAACHGSASAPLQIKKKTHFLCFVAFIFVCTSMIDEVIEIKLHNKSQYTAAAATWLCES
jgi:hypothetical protein